MRCATEAPDAYVIQALVRHPPQKLAHPPVGLLPSWDRVLVDALDQEERRSRVPGVVDQA